VWHGTALFQALECGFLAVLGLRSADRDSRIISRVPTLHSIRTRVARSRDVERMLALLEQPGDGYGPSSSSGLKPLLARLLDEQAVRGPVLRPRAGGPRGAAELDACALTGFTTLERARAWIANPPSHFVDHVLECERAGEAVLLRPEGVAALNPGEGMALVYLAFRIPSADDATMHAQIMSLMGTFRLLHSGYFCPLALHPDAPGERGYETLHRLGFRQTGSLWTFELDDLELSPYSMMAALSRRPPPRCAFSVAEKAHLECAILGSTDPEIADELEVSLDTVRKRWASIYQRVAARDDLAILPRVEITEMKRGPEKRGAVLAYLETHLEELRPYRRA
jgi:hypothetical protein